MVMIVDGWGKDRPYFAVISGTAIEKTDFENCEYVWPDRTSGFNTGRTTDHFRFKFFRNGRSGQNLNGK
jgi:hypothetical protein